MLIAASRGHIKTTDILLEHGLELEAFDSNDRTVIHIATMEGHHEYLDHILGQKSGQPTELINGRDIHHNTALHIAAQHGHLECLN